MKASKYNIVFDYKGKKLAFNGLSAAFAEIDDNFIRLLDNIKNIKEDELSEKDKDLLEDMKRGSFVLDDDTNELNIIKLNSYLGKFRPSVLGLTIAPTLQCNFACPYCYEQRQTGMISKDVIDAIYKKVQDAAEHKSNISINWYGGEPLLAKDVIAEMSQKMIEICEKNNVKYDAYIVTNGYLINEETVKMFKKAKIMGAQITVDGPPEIHNARRKLCDPTIKTFDVIIKNIQLLMKNDIPVHIRINIDRTNIDKLEELLEILTQNGLQKCGIGLGHVKDYTSTCQSVAHDCLSNKEYAEETVKQQKILLKHGFRTVDYPYYPGVKANYCCADRLDSFVVGHDGELYKCWNDVGVKKHSVGNIKNDLALTNSNVLHQKYLLWSPFNYTECVECEYLPICMGGCPFNGMKSGKPECEKWVYNLIDILKVRYDAEQMIYSQKEKVSTQV
ncbi:MAG: SPASM domain-containing protein [Oscillospiraceae bacterium]|nr:SPASM domain-containing protein [Oscillospiraceae bacterium]